MSTITLVAFFGPNSVSKSSESLNDLGAENWRTAGVNCSDDNLTGLFDLPSIELLIIPDVCAASALFFNCDSRCCARALARLDALSPNTPSEKSSASKSSNVTVSAKKCTLSRRKIRTKQKYSYHFVRMLV